MKTIIALVVFLCVTSAPIHAQTPPPGYKDPGTSTLLSVVVPGGGQIYSGETNKGLLLLGGGLGGLMLGVAMSASSVGVSCDDDFDCRDDTNYAPMALGYLAYFGTWVYGIIDADDSAHRMNSRRGLAQVLPGGVAPLVATSGDGTRVGISLRF
ncbi:MAG TPA: hypothetical protein VHG93_19120 [Longimicrobium sp.]|nr:hypothetical protein [Longimicrobium sp.]